MKRKKIVKSLLCMIPIYLVIGCSNLEKKDDMQNLHSMSDTELLNIVDNKDFVKYKNNVLHYDLGNVYLGEDGEKVNIDLKGIIGVPKVAKNVPIIFIISGNNNSNNNEQISYVNTYKGFEYLVDSLSKAGFLTVAINTNMTIDEYNQEFVVEDKILNLVYEKHFNYLKESIEGNNNSFGISLYNKGDIDNIGLIGQCNTGRTIFNIANEQVSKEISSIKGLLSITPNAVSIVSSYSDIPTAILATEHSSDTTVGFDMYNDIKNIKNRDSFIELTYLIGGNADKFNNLVNEDTLDGNNANGNVSLARASSLTNEDTITDSSIHEDFLKNYSVDFFEYIFGKDIKNSLFDVKTPTVQKLYGKDILSKLYTGNEMDLFNSSYSDNIVVNNIKTTNVIESSILALDTAIDFNEPSTNLSLDLLQLDWKNRKASLSIPINDEKENFSNYNSISIEWALNHSSELNLNDLNEVSILLEDEKGDLSRVRLLDEMPLNKIVGNSEIKTIDDKNYSTWSRFTPIAESRVPLSLFEGLDLNNIKNMYIDFGNNESGSIYLKSISLK